jgi:hypothetical protein
MNVTREEKDYIENSQPHAAHKDTMQESPHAERHSIISNLGSNDQNDIIRSSVSEPAYAE